MLLRRLFHCQPFHWLAAERMKSIMPMPQCPRQRHHQKQKRRKKALSTQRLLHRRRQNKSADNKSTTKGSDATAPANNTSKTENNSKTSGSSQSQSSNKSAQSGSQTNGQTNSQTNNQSSKSTNKNTSNSTNTNNGSSSKSSSADPHAGKTWHEAVYKTVNHPAVTGERKVIDQPADSYEEPVYETRKIHKCKDCGIDLLQLSQSERIAHANQHIDEGGDGGWYTATEQVQVGTRTVEVPEQSHMETYIVKEAWTEKVLVKEAGWS